MTEHTFALTTRATPSGNTQFKAYCGCGWLWKVWHWDEVYAHDDWVGHIRLEMGPGTSAKLPAYSPREYT